MNTKINKHKTVWDIEVGDKFYSFVIDEDIFSYTFDNHPLDISARERGNMFLTREEAEFELERRKIEVVMRKYSRPYKEEGNFYIYYSHSLSMIIIGTTIVNAGNCYFESIEMAQKAIKEIGEDRLKKYWFRIGEQDE